jgi:hypothetical protein
MLLDYSLPIETCIVAESGDGDYSEMTAAEGASRKLFPAGGGKSLC